MLEGSYLELSAHITSTKLFAVHIYLLEEIYFVLEIFFVYNIIPFRSGVCSIITQLEETKTPFEQSYICRIPPTIAVYLVNSPLILGVRGCIDEKTANMWIISYICTKGSNSPCPIFDDGQSVIRYTRSVRRVEIIQY